MVGFGFFPKREGRGPLSSSLDGGGRIAGAREDQGSLGLAEREKKPARGIVRESDWYWPAGERSSSTDGLPGTCRTSRMG